MTVLKLLDLFRGHALLKLVPVAPESDRRATSVTMLELKTLFKL